VCCCEVCEGLRVATAKHEQGHGCRWCAGWVVGKFEHGQRRGMRTERGRVVQGVFVSSDICIA
jgi:hypothetical protein